jgi:uncharacterized protein with von Willebrand factor type A (vWA) domain
MDRKHPLLISLNMKMRSCKYEDGWDENRKRDGHDFPSVYLYKKYKNKKHNNEIVMKNT